MDSLSDGYGSHASSDNDGYNDPFPGNWPRKWREYTKRCLLSWTQSLSYDHLPPKWQEFLEIESENARGLWFQSQVQGYIDEDKRGFDYDWHYLPTFQRYLYKLEFTPPGISKGDWWRGIIGNQLARANEDIQLQQEYDEYDENSRLQLSQENLEQRKSGAPLRIDSYAKLQEFVGRVMTFTGDFFPRSSLHSQSRKLWKHLRHNRTTYDNKGWMRNGPSDIIYWFKKIEGHDFTTVLSLDDFFDPQGVLFTSSEGYELPSILLLCRTGPHYDNDSLPVGLRVSAPTPRTETPAKKRVRGTDEGSPSPNKQPKVKLPSYTNTEFSPIFKAYWASAPPEIARTQLTKLFAKGDITLNAVLQKLGLPKRSCGHFHVRGYCKDSKICANHDLKHAPKAIGEEDAKELCLIMDKSKN